MEPQEITEELEHPGAGNLLDSATLVGLQLLIAVPLVEASRGISWIAGTLTQCDPFGIPSTSHWTGAAIIV
jgi:hypothetical protein